MVIHKVLDEVFSTWSNIAVLRVLRKCDMGITGREVARLSGMSPKNCLITLSTLENYGMVYRVRGGRDHIFSLNRENVIVKEVVLTGLQVEEEYFERLAADIKKLLRKFTVSIIVFGSVARKEETLESDIDLCLLIKDKAHKEAIEKRLPDIQAVIKKKYGIAVSPIYFTQTEFVLKAKSKKPPLNGIVKDGILISGLSIRELLND